MALAPFQKNFYTLHPITSSRSEADVAKYRTSKEITVRGKDVPQPVQTFSEAGFPNCMNDVFGRLGYDEPTPVQAQVWPIALSGLDLVAIAQTGLDKILAYMLPAVFHIGNQPVPQPGKGPCAVVLAPTRELAQQIQIATNEFANTCGLKSMVTFDGASVDVQAKQLQLDPEVVIATPGCLIDIVRAGLISMERCTFVVLDEVDKMIDMGFVAQMETIFGFIRPDRQAIMLSATWPNRLKQLHEKFIPSAVLVNFGSLQLCANQDINQMVDVCEEKEKEQKFFELMEKLLLKNPDSRILIFVFRRIKADQLMVSLRATMKVNARSVHGDKSVADRKKAIQDFSSGACNVLIATDAAVQDLDVDDVNYVIIYDYPEETRDYIHHIGFVGRRHQSGTAFTFFTRADIEGAKNLVAILEDANQEVNPRLKDLAKSQSHVSHWQILKWKKQRKDLLPGKKKIKKVMLALKVPRSAVLDGDVGDIFRKDFLVEKKRELIGRDVGKNKQESYLGRARNRYEGGSDDATSERSQEDFRAGTSFRHNGAEASFAECQLSRVGGIDDVEPCRERHGAFGSLGNNGERSRSYFGGKSGGSKHTGSWGGSIDYREQAGNSSNHFGPGSYRSGEMASRGTSSQGGFYGRDGGSDRKRPRW